MGRAKGKSHSTMLYRKNDRNCLVRGSCAENLCACFGSCAGSCALDPSSSVSGASAVFILGMVDCANLPRAQFCAHLVHTLCAHFRPRGSQFHKVS